MRIALFTALAACTAATLPPPSQGSDSPLPATSITLPTLPEIPITRAASREGSPIVLAHRGHATLAVIADADAGELRVVDVDRGFELSALPLGGHPGQLVMLADHRVAVAVRDRDEVAIVRARGLALAVEQRVAVAGEPIGLALSPDDRTLLVTSGWGHTLTALAVEAGRPVSVARHWPLSAEPRSVVVSDDGRRAFVSHAVGEHVEIVELAGKVANVSLAGKEEVSERHGIHGDEPRQVAQGFALTKSMSPAGRIYAPHVQVFAGDPARPTDGYGGGERGPAEIFDVAVLDEDRPAVIAESVAVREQRIPCTLPRAAATSRTGSLFVACDGANTVVELDGASVAPAVVDIQTWQVPDGPAGLAFDEPGQRLVVWSQRAHAVTILDATGRQRPRSAALEDRARMADAVARGRALFAATGDARISNDGRACESCHPEGRQDALVWSTPQGPRQAPMLAGRVADTAPYGWNGDVKDVKNHLARTLKRLHGSGLPAADRDALIAYVESIAPPAPPSGDAALIAEGETLFRSHEEGCASCHGDDGRHPDGLAHDVRSEIQEDTRREFDTPSLASIAGTAPYYHDGRFATLRELLVATRGRMGGRRKLSGHELDALEAYLRSL